jgi:hypothetical protein
MEGSRREERELMLETYLAPGIRRGVDRWRSFGWEVTEIYPAENIPLGEVPVSRLPASVADDVARKWAKARNSR